MSIDMYGKLNEIKLNQITLEKVIKNFFDCNIYELIKISNYTIVKRKQCSNYDFVIYDCGDVKNEFTYDLNELNREFISKQSVVVEFGKQNLDNLKYKIIIQFFYYMSRVIKCDILIDSDTRNEICIISNENIEYFTYKETIKRLVDDFKVVTGCIYGSSNEFDINNRIEKLELIVKKIGKTFELNGTKISYHKNDLNDELRIYKHRKNGDILNILTFYMHENNSEESIKSLKETNDKIKLMNIDMISWYDEILLDFLYEYFKICPNDYFSSVGSSDLIFTKEDIGFIKENIGFYRDWSYRKPGEKALYKNLDELTKILVNYIDGTYIKVEWNHGSLVVGGYIDGIRDFSSDAQLNIMEYCTCFLQIDEIINNSINYDFEEEGYVIDISIKHEPTRIELYDGTVIWNNNNAIK